MFWVNIMYARIVIGLFSGNPISSLPKARINNQKGSLKHKRVPRAPAPTGLCCQPAARIGNKEQPRSGRQNTADHSADPDGLAS